MATVSLNSGYYCVKLDAPSAANPGKSCPAGYETTQLTNFTALGSSNASTLLLLNGGNLTGALFSSSKFNFQNDFKVIFTVKATDVTSYYTDGFVLAISNTMFCKAPSIGAFLAYNGYNNGAVIGEFDWFGNFDIGDISYNSISIHDCLNSPCNYSENANTSQIKMSDTVSDYYIIINNRDT